MKLCQQYLAACVLLLTGCLSACGGAGPVTTSPKPAAFGTSHLLKVGAQVKFEDGLEIALQRIHDSRCPPDVTCIWAGELAPELRLRGGELAETSRTLILGTERARDQSAGSYRIALSDATPESATLIVTKVAAASSGVHGEVLLGPTCPVERMPPDPACADRLYAATFHIATPVGVSVATVSSGADGKFSIALPPGSYVISLKGEAAMPSMAPQSFTVSRDAYLDLRLSLDSGIR